ncbi:uncharacterized protein [Rutidosis leptorrhynchoides]|uniref:uncharacterized protein n=1 Tax=Rutidosis leptorrhynchoides TaxID=125765 RepID=UPI003A99DDA9
MAENTSLNYLRNNQKILRVSSLTHLYDAQDSGSSEVSNIGNRVVLPSSFTGGARYMRENYLDAMAIVRAFGHPDLFITFTCNPKWPEILRFLTEDDLKPEDRPDIITGDEYLFGKSLGVVAVIEFQKRGLPHCHLCLFMDKEGRVPTSADIDKIICAEIPDKEEDPDLYSIVADFIMHGPCGTDHPTCPCMIKYKCSKYFPKEFSNETHFDGQGFPVYKRRDDGHFIMKGDTPLDNRNVVAYKKQLSKQFQSHINVEWCNQIGSIKYLFKYINKGPDRISVRIENSDGGKSIQKKKQGKDEIADYYSCRYISACEAARRLFNFPTIYLTPAVYRLSFHLPNHEPIYYDGEEDFESVLSKPTVGASQFIEWMNCNKIDQHARQYTYLEFPRYYVWNSGPRHWTRRKSQLVVARIHFVPPKSGETYYLRILLNKVKGPTCFEDIRTVNGILYDTFKEACYTLGLLDDDREYVASIKDTHAWASGEFCRSLFVSLITTDSLSFPDCVWNETCDLLSDDLHHECPPHVSTTDEAELKKVLYNLVLSKI